MLCEDGYQCIPCRPRGTCEHRILSHGVWWLSGFCKAISSAFLKVSPVVPSAIHFAHLFLALIRGPPRVFRTSQLLEVHAYVTRHLSHALIFADPQHLCGSNADRLKGSASRDEKVHLTPTRHLHFFGMDPAASCALASNDAQLRRKHVYVIGLTCAPRMSVSRSVFGIVSTFCILGYPVGRVDSSRGAHSDISDHYRGCSACISIVRPCTTSIVCSLQAQALVLTTSGPYALHPLAASFGLASKPLTLLTNLRCVL